MIIKIKGNNQELEEKIMKVCERMTVVNKHLEDDQDEMISFLKQNNVRNDIGNSCTLVFRRTREDVES